MMKLTPAILLTFGLLFALTQGDTIDSRIIGGHEATPHSHPYIAYLTFTVIVDGLGYARHCGGTLISKNYVLSSASCAFGANSVQVYIGAHDITQINLNQFIGMSKDILIHEAFNNETYINDISLIKLPITIPYNEVMQPATLPSADEASKNYQGTNATVSGWGITPTGKISYVLLDAQVEISPNSACESININDSQICSNAQEGPCSQDLGGPLVVTGTSKLIGIGSHGDGNCQNGSITAYTKVANHLSWIQENSDVTINE